MAQPAAISRYQIRDRLGHGGMGVLYLALDPAITMETKRQVSCPIEAVPCQCHVSRRSIGAGDRAGGVDPAVPVHHNAACL